MASVTDELSVKITLRDELSTKIAATKKEVKAASNEVATLTRRFQETGEGANELRHATQRVRDLKGNLSKLERSARDTTKQIDKMTSTTTRFSRAVTHLQKLTANPLVAGASIASIGYFAKTSLESFSQVQDASSALNATFGKSGDALIEWARRSGDAFNLSQVEALNAAQTFAIYGQSAGLAGTKLETMASSLAERAADLASYFGGTTADAIQALGSAMRGEQEPARRYGIMLDDMTMRAKAFEMGLTSTTKDALTPQQKVLAAYQLILEKTAFAQGDVARTSDSMANTLKDSQQQMADFKAVSGETVAIVAGPLLKVLNAAMRAFQQLSSPIRALITGLGFIGAIALIVVPRLIAMRANMNLAGITMQTVATRARTLGLAMRSMLGPIGLAITALGFWAEASGNAKAAAEDLASSFDSVSGAATTLTRQKIGEEFLKNFSITDLQQTPFTLQQIVDAALAGGDAYHELYLQVEKYSRETLLANPLQARWLSSLANSIDAAHRDAQAATELAKSTKYAGDAAGVASNNVDTLSGAMSDLESAADPAAAALDKVSAAIDVVDRAMARRQARVDYKKALDDFIKKPSMATADAAAKAASALADTYSNPRKKAMAYGTALQEIEAAIMNSKLKQKQQQTLIHPMDVALSKLAAVKREIDSLNSASANITVISRRAGDVEKRAAGGAVFGAGTATSDSIPALLSNGEYVIRAHAAQTIGYDTLDRLNVADRVPSHQIALRNTDVPRAERFETHVQSGPLIGRVEINNPSAEIDVERAVARAVAKAERMRRERA